MRLTILVVIWCVALEDVTARRTARKTTKKSMEEFKIALRRFAGFLTYRTINSDSGNMIYSPTSLAEVLGMLEAGARGETKSQIQSAMLLQSADAEWVTNLGNLFRKTGNRVFDLKTPKRQDKALVTMANKMYIQDQFEIIPGYAIELEQHYGAEAETLDFSLPSKAAQKINKWVHNKTGGMIQDLVSPDDLNALTRLVLVNGLYFKAKWRTTMKLQGGKTFNGQAGRQQVDFIGEKMKIPLKVSNGVETVYLDYKSSIDTYMVISVPQDSNAWSQFLNYNSLLNYFGTITTKPSAKTVFLSMPKFELEEAIDMEPIFKLMGIYNMFDINAANFSGITTGEDLHVSTFKHKAKITVDEYGTKASAATLVSLLARSSQRVYRMTVNKPFVFSIVRDGHILFFGKVADLN